MCVCVCVFCAKAYKFMGDFMSLINLLLSNFIGQSVVIGVVWYKCLVFVFVSVSFIIILLASSCVNS